MSEESKSTLVDVTNDLLQKLYDSSKEEPSAYDGGLPDGVAELRYETFRNPASRKVFYYMLYFSFEDALDLDVMREAAESMRILTKVEGGLLRMYKKPFLRRAIKQQNYLFSVSDIQRNTYVRFIGLDESGKRTWVFDKKIIGLWEAYRRLKYKED